MDDNAKVTCVGESVGRLKKSREEKEQRKISKPKMETLKEVLSDQWGFRFFAEFMASEHSVELVQFWEDVNEYRRLATAKVPGATEKAQQIWKDFLSSSSPGSVNVPLREKSKITERQVNRKPALLTLFDDLQKSVFTTMEEGAFQRFLQSPLHARLLLRISTKDFSEEISSTLDGRHSETSSDSEDSARPRNATLSS